MNTTTGGVHPWPSDERSAAVAIAAVGTLAAGAGHLVLLVDGHATMLMSIILLGMTPVCAWCAVRLLRGGGRGPLVMVAWSAVAMIVLHLWMLVTPGDTHGTGVSGHSHHGHHEASPAESTHAFSTTVMWALTGIEVVVLAACAVAAVQTRSRPKSFHQQTSS